MLNRDPHVHEISPDRFEPRIVAFFCNWCTYLAADLAGTSRMKYAPERASDSPDVFRPCRSAVCS